MTPGINKNNIFSNSEMNPSVSWASLNESSEHLHKAYGSLKEALECFDTKSSMSSLGMAKTLLVMSEVNLGFQDAKPITVRYKPDLLKYEEIL